MRGLYNNVAENWQIFSLSRVDTREWYYTKHYYVSVNNFKSQIYKVLEPKTEFLKVII